MIEELHLEGQKICQIIRKKIADVPLEIIAKKMGYFNLKKGADRIEMTVNDTSLGLLKSNYDGVHTSVSFLDKLLQTIGLNDDMVTKQIEKIKAEKFDKDFGYRPWVFCDTNFKRTGQNIFVLACLESRRRISLPKKIKKLSKKGKIKFAREGIKKGQLETNGEIEFWGTVIKYVCHFEKDEVIEFLPDGTIISEKNEEVKHGGASLKVNNKLLAGVEQ